LILQNNQMKKKPIERIRTKSKGKINLMATMKFWKVSVEIKKKNKKRNSQPRPNWMDLHHTCHLGRQVALWWIKKNQRKQFLVVVSRNTYHLNTTGRLIHWRRVQRMHQPFLLFFIYIYIKKLNYHIIIIIIIKGKVWISS